MLNIHQIIIAGNVQALMDIWFVGDAFLRETFPTMQTLKTSTSMDNKSLPFIYKQFNVFYFFMSRNTFIQNILTKVHNAIVEGLNRRDYLLKYIVFMLDEDFIVAMDHFVFGISHLITTCLNWLSVQIERLLDARADQLHLRKPGAVYANTKLIWVKMLG